MAGRPAGGAAGGSAGGPDPAVVPGSGDRLLCGAGLAGDPAWLLILPAAAVDRRACLAAARDRRGVERAEPASPDPRAAWREAARAHRGGEDGRTGQGQRAGRRNLRRDIDRKSTRLNSSHANISYAVFCLKKNINPARELRAAWSCCGPSFHPDLWLTALWPPARAALLFTLASLFPASRDVGVFFF